MIRGPLKYAAGSFIDSTFPSDKYEKINSLLHTGFDATYLVGGFLTEMYLFNKLSRKLLTHLGPHAEYAFYR